MTVIATGFGAQRRRRARSRDRRGLAARATRAGVRGRATRSTCRRSCAATEQSHEVYDRAHDAATRGVPSRDWSAVPHDPVRSPAGTSRGASSIPRSVAPTAPGTSSDGLASPADADAPPDAALRPARRARRADGAVRRLGDAGAVRGRDPGAPGRAHRRRRLRRLAHGRARGRGPDGARAAAGAALERPRPARARRRAVHAADERERRDHRRPDRLPRSTSTGTCSSSTPRTATPTSRGCKERELRGSDVRDVSDDYALLAVQGPRALERLGLAPATRVHVGDGRGRRRRGDGQPHRLHRRGGRRARLHGRGRGPRSGTRSSRAASFRAGSARATRCGSRSATRCTATTSARSGTRSRPGSAGPARSTRTSPASSGCARSRRPARAQKLVAFVMTEQAIPRQGMAIEGGGEVTSGSHSPMLEVGIGLGYVPAGLRAPGTELTIDVRGKAAPRRGRARSRSTRRRSEWPRAESYPDDLLYHPEHDWARIDGRRGRARRHLVRAGRARRARALRAARGRRDGRRRTARTARSSR